MKQFSMIDMALQLAREALALGYIEIAEQALNIAADLREKAVAEIDNKATRMEAAH